MDNRESVVGASGLLRKLTHDAIRTDVFKCCERQLNLTAPSERVLRPSAAAETKFSPINIDFEQIWINFAKM